MAETTYYLAIDIGASSGRHILGWMDKGKIRMEEIYRFENKLEKRNGHLCWDLDHLFHEVVEGLRKCKELDRIPESVGIDTWASTSSCSMPTAMCSAIPSPTATAARRAWMKRSTR